MDSGVWYSALITNEVTSPCRWLVEVELPPGQVRTALRATLSLHALAVPGDSLRVLFLKHESLLCCV